MTLGRARWAVTLLTLAAPAAGAQQFVPDPATATIGLESRYYAFGQALGVRSLGQWAIPLAVIVPRGRFTLDAGAWLASTMLTRLDGERETVTGLTDTQLRGSYVLGHDAVVFTAMVNLPTGAHNLSAADYAVLAAASSSFLAFPVNTYGSGLSVTAGAAGAFTSGPWNLGAAGSFRLSEQYAPFVDASGTFQYQSGPEVRLRAGADRLVRSARLSLGLTFSTFSNDEYATGGGAAGVYRPGRRLIAEAYYATLIGGWAVTGYAWDFYRWSGDSAGVSVRNRENLIVGGVAASIGLGRTVTWEPGVEGRLSMPEEGRAMLLEFSSSFQVRLGPSWRLIPMARFGFGRLEEPTPGYGHSITGFGLSAYIRRLL